MHKGEINITGSVDIKLIGREGDLIRHVREKNLVLNGGKTNTANLLGGKVAGTAVTKIGVGTSNAASAVTDNALTDAFVKALASASVAGSKVTFEYSIDFAEANGKTINEFGLLTTGDVLFARKNLSEPIVKSNSFKIEGTWIIDVT